MRTVCSVIWSVLGAAVLSLAIGCAQPMNLRTQPTPTPAKPPASHTVVFIHGMYMTPQCWADWERLFQERGYQTLAPAWPGHDAAVATQRQASVSAERGALTLDQILTSYRTILAGLPEKPILIGHSMGGLVVQLLLAEGLGVAGIAIDSAPPQGLISTKFSFVRSNWPVISPTAKIAVPITLTFAQFQYAFMNGMPEAEQRVAFEKHIVPESRRVGKGPTTAVAKIDFTKARPPLLLIAGSSDHIIPASLNRSNFHRYDRTPAVTDFHEFAGRTHWLIADSGWPEIANYTLDWVHSTLQE